MKKLYFSVFAILACIISFAKTTTAITSGDWSQVATWDNGLPAQGDIIIIPSLYTVNLSSNQNIKDLQLQISGVLNVSTFTINMSGSTSWKIEIFSSGSIQGTGAIKDGGTTIYNGTTVTGPKIASNTSPTFTTPAPLPVKFTGFSLALQNSNVLVQWSTAEEVNASAYNVERSTDGATWTKVATITAKGNTSYLTNYTYTDKNVTSAVTYYRIKQVDIDGQYTYTTIKSIRSGANAVEVKVAAINNRVVLQFSNEVKGAVEVCLVTLAGQVVSKQVLNQPVGQVVLNNVAMKGNYIVSVSNAQDINVAKQVSF